MKLKDMLKMLPKDYKKACWETKAMERKRGIQDEDIRLTLCLYYSYENSLVDTQNYALTKFMVDISDVGFMKRFRNCNEWIKWIIRREMKTLYRLISNCFFNIQSFDFQSDFLLIVMNCCVEKRKSGVRLQLSDLKLS